MSEKHNESSGGVETTGHLWDDDLADYANQPPKWWMIGLTASALWVVVYWLIYPSVPVSLAGDHWKGLNIFNGGQRWTAIRERMEDEKEITALRKPYEDKIKSMTPAAILADRELSEYVSRSGKVLFGDNCAACHGQNGVGNKGRGTDGFMAPVLRDDDWLYGGKIDTIHETITGGRQGMMVAHKDSLSAQQIDDIAQWEHSMSEGGSFDDPKYAAGKTAFEGSDCTACHGPDAKGLQAMGSANLTDKVCRFDCSIEGLKQTITYGVNSGEAQARVAIMPNFKAAGKLSEADIKKLAVYVYRFGGGQADEPVAAPVVAAVVDAAAVAVAPAAK
jgi:cytochrome c oxidase cbb3-type subunit III